MRGSGKFDCTREPQSVGSKGESSLGRKDAAFPGQEERWVKMGA